MAVALKEMEAICQGIGRTINSSIEKAFDQHRVGFCLLLFDFGDDGHLTYISNADKEDMINALAEAIDVLKRSVSIKDNSKRPESGQT